MTNAEYNRIVRELDRKLVNGEITAEEYREKKRILRAMKEQEERKARDQVGADPGNNAKDRAIRQYSREIQAIYGQASEEMRKKLKEFTDKYQKKLAKKQREKAEGKITHEQFWDWLNGQQDIMDGMKDKIDQLSGVMLNANQKAMAMANDEMLGVFAENANWQSYQLEQDTNMDLMFSIYDENTVERLIREKPELLPRRKVNGRKDKAWNQKQIANAVTQSILQGESIPGLAERIAKETAEKNGKVMLRYARTAMTGAQNSGRVEMLHRAQGLGIKVKKRWLATLDSRTRDSHQHMDGVSVGVDEEFQTPLGSKMQYPGDPNGKGGDVWNCRCTLVYDYDGFPNDPAADVRRDNETGEVIPNMTYDEWKKYKAGEQQPAEQEPVNIADRIRKTIANHQGDWSVDDLQKVGADMAKLVEERIAENPPPVDYAKTINEIETEFRDVRDQYAKQEKIYKKSYKSEDRDKLNELAKNWNELYYKQNQAVQDSTDYYSKHMREALSEIRALGGVKDGNRTKYMTVKTGKAAAALTEAMNYYPSAWLGHSANNSVALKPKWTTGRACYRPGFGEILVDGKLGTGIHEMAHRFEHSMPGLKKAEKEFYERRTAGEDLTWLGEGYAITEKTRYDKFINKYMGKDYRGTAYELASMGFEYAYTQYDKLSQDADMRDWTLGLLACL